MCMGIASKSCVKSILIDENEFMLKLLLFHTKMISA